MRKPRFFSGGRVVYVCGYLHVWERVCVASGSVRFTVAATVAAKPRPVREATSPSERDAAIALRGYIVEKHGVAGVLEPSLLPTTFFRDLPWAKARIVGSGLSPSKFCEQFSDLLKWTPGGIRIRCVRSTSLESFFLVRFK